MNILITGATGMIGSQLQRELTAHKLWCLMRRDPEPGELAHGVPVRSVSEVEGPIDAVINLAGENIGAKRWTSSRKDLLRSSRIEFTRDLVEALEHGGHAPKVWINASAVGYYGDRPGEALTEAAAAGNDFAAALCRDWEHEVPEIDGQRRVIFRLGVVIGDGGAVAEMRLPFKLGLGAVMGPGEQHMPWIALEDVCAAMVSALDNAAYEGTINLVSPQPADQREFSKTLASTLGRPLLFRFPAPLLRVLFGEMSALFLVDQRVTPARLEALDFDYQLPQLETALQVAVSN